MLLSKTKLIIIITLFIFFRNALRRLPGRSRGDEQKQPCCSREMGVKGGGGGGDYKDNFFLREMESGGRGRGSGRGGRVVEMVGVGEVEGLGMEQGEMDK